MEPNKGVLWRSCSWDSRPQREDEKDISKSGCQLKKQEGQKEENYYQWNRSKKFVKSKP